MMKAAIFDLDGTLVNSAPDIHACINLVLKEKGFPPLDLDQVRSFIGHGIGNLVERCFEAAGSPRSGEALARCIVRFVDIYAAAPVKHGSAYPGVKETLEQLKSEGWSLGICTNKADQLTGLVLDGLGLASLFDAVVSSNSLMGKKPNPEPLIECARRLGHLPEDIVYVGDSETDAETARRADAPFVLFTEGYRKASSDLIPHDAKFSDWPEAMTVIDFVRGKPLEAVKPS